MLLRAFCMMAMFAAAPALAQPPSMRELAAASESVPAPTLVERYGPDDLRSGELRVPAGAGPFPVVVLVHGGCWLNSMGGRAQFAPIADALARRGIASWNLRYRRIGDEGGGWPGTFEDVAAGVEHLRALARRYPLDLNRLSFVGHSSGAHLALWAASRHRLVRPIGPTPALRPVSAMAIDGPGTLAPLIGVDRRVCGRDVIVPLMGGTPEQRPDAYRLASPSDNLPLGMRQLFVTANLAPLMQDYIAASRTAGDDVQAIAPDGSDHFNVLVPGNAVGAAVVDLIATQAFPGR